MSKSSIKKKLENFLKDDEENNEPSNEKPLADDKSSNEENEIVAQLMGDCPSCFRDTKELMKNTLNFHNEYDKQSAKEYCENHNGRYIGHKCIVDWCGDCGFHIKYVVEIDHSKANYDR